MGLPQVQLSKEARVSLLLLPQHWATEPKVSVTSTGIKLYMY